MSYIFKTPFIILSLFFVIKSFSISNGTTFFFINKTSQNIKFHQISKTWFNQVADETIAPGSSFSVYLEGECFHPWAQEDATTNWNISSTDASASTVHTFALQVVNRTALNCAKRLFTVDGQFRKIELAPIGTDEKSTPTPYFRFTAMEKSENPFQFDLLQEGPQRDHF